MEHETFDDFLDRQQRRVRYILIHAQNRLNHRVEPFLMPQVEVRKAQGSHSCQGGCSAEYDRRREAGL